MGMGTVLGGDVPEQSLILGRQQVALASEDGKKMPAADLSGCHCGCRWWWGREEEDLSFFP